MIDTHFDGFAICCLDPSVEPANSPFYLFAWTHADVLTLKEDVGTVYSFDINGQNKTQPKFIIQCPKGQEIETKFSPTGHAVLVWSQSFSDTTGKSYYGEHTLQYIQIFGGRERSFVPCFNNTIHDLCWIPDGENFIVIAGTQPAIATLYDKNCTPLFEFGKRYRNTIRVCPFS